LQASSAQQGEIVHKLSEQIIFYLQMKLNQGIAQVNQFVESAFNMIEMEVRKTESVFDKLVGTITNRINETLYPLPDQIAKELKTQIRLLVQDAKQNLKALQSTTAGPRRLSGFESGKVMTSIVTALSNQMKVVYNQLVSDLIDTKPFFESIVDGAMDVLQDLIDQAIPYVTQFTDMVSSWVKLVNNTVGDITR